MAQAITLILLFGLPLLYIPGLQNPFEPPKVLLAQLLILFLIVAGIWSGFLKKIHWRTPAIAAMSVILCIALIHVFRLYSPSVLFGNVYRLQGVVLTIYLVCLALFGSRLKHTNIPSVAPILSLSILFVAALVIPPNQSHRYIGTLGEPNALAATAVIWFPFAVSFASKRWRAFLITIVTLALLLLSGSRSGYIAFGIELLALYLWHFKKWSLRNIVLASLACMALSHVLPFTESKGLYENRAEIWRVGIAAGMKSPVIGSGVGNAEHSIRAAAKELESPIQYAYVDSAHNIFIDWFIQTGLIGLSAFVYILYVAVHACIKQKNVPVLLAFVGLLTAASFNPLSVASLVFLWWFIGESVYANRQ